MGTAILLLICGLYLVASNDNLFTRDGVLVQKRGDVKTLSGVWTIYITINPPPHPQVTDRLKHLAQIIQGPSLSALDIDASVEQRFLWLSRLNRLNVINSQTYETNPAIYETKWKRSTIRPASISPVEAPAEIPNVTEASPAEVNPPNIDNTTTPDGNNQLQAALQTLTIERVVTFQELVTANDTRDTVMSERREGRPVNVIPFNPELYAPLNESEQRPTDENNLHREKRGLFDFMGEISKVLFGTATSTEVQNIREVINTNNEQVSILRHNQEKFLSVFNKTQAYISENRDLIQNIHANIDLIQQSLNETYGNLQNLEKRIRTVEIARIIDTNLDLLDEIMHEYVMQLQVFHQQQLQLERGWLSRDLFPTNQLSEILDHIRAAYLDVLPVTWYYHSMKITPIHDPEHILGQLAFKVYIPAISDYSYLHYKINYFKVPLGENQLRKIKGENDIVIDTSNGYSFVMDENRCIGNLPTICAPGKLNLQPTCETSLLAGQVSSLCEIEITQTSNDTLEFYQESIFDNEIILVAYVRQSATLRCMGASPETLSILGPTRIAVNHTCNLITPDWRINGILLSRASLELINKHYVTLPPLNVTWPRKLNYEVLKKIQLTKVADIKWDELPTLQELHFASWDYSYFKRHGLTLGLGITVVLLVIIMVLMGCRKRICKKIRLCYRYKGVPRKNKMDNSESEAIQLRPLPSVPHPSAPSNDTILNNIGKYHKEIMPYATSSNPNSPPSNAPNNRTLSIVEENPLYNPYEPNSLPNIPRVKTPYDTSTIERFRVE